MKASLKELLKQSEIKILNDKNLVFYCFECNNSFTIKKYIEHQDVKHKPKNWAIIFVGYVGYAYVN